MLSLPLARRRTLLFDPYKSRCRGGLLRVQSYYQPYYGAFKHEVIASVSGDKLAGT
jgi:hypothetical protein